jgi:hypothetical protein
MNAVLIPAVGDTLTITQRQVLRTARRSWRLECQRAGGVAALDAAGMPMMPRFPLRTVNALERGGYLVARGKGWDVTSAGRAAAGKA